MTLLFVLIFLDLSSYPGCLPGLYFVQGSLFLAGRTGSYMAAVSKVIKHPITEANNRKIDKKNYLNLWIWRARSWWAIGPIFCAIYTTTVQLKAKPPPKSVVIRKSTEWKLCILEERWAPHICCVAENPELGWRLWLLRTKCFQIRHTVPLTRTPWSRLGMFSLFPLYRSEEFDLNFFWSVKRTLSWRDQADHT